MKSIIKEDKDKTNQSTLIDTKVLCSKIVKVGDIQRLLNISYRQINDWDSKGTLPNQRKRNDKKSWRTFNGLDVLQLSIAFNLRKLGLSLSLIKLFIESISEDESIKGIKLNFLDSAIMQMSLGFNMFIYFDSKGYRVCSENDLYVEYLNNPNKPIILLPINSLVSEVLKLCGLPEIKTDKSLQLANRVKNNAKQKQDIDKKEKEILKIIKERNYQTVTVYVQDGSIIRIKREESIKFNK